MAYYHDYSFQNPIIKGKPTRYFQVLYYLYKNGATLKKDLVEAVWGKPKSSFNTAWQYRDTIIYDNILRGYCSNTFGQMTSAGLITYNPHDKKRVISKEGIAIVKNTMDKYGKAYVEQLFNF